MFVLCSVLFCVHIYKYKYKYKYTEVYLLNIYSFLLALPMKTIDLINPSSEDTIKFTEVCKSIHKSKKTTVLTGAGISCNAGIPDFRSSDGLYNMVKKTHPKLVVRGQDLFDISLFRDEVSLLVFCTFMEALYVLTKQAKPTETHRFIKTLKDKNKLLRCYTQNIDGLERELDLNTGLHDAHLQKEQTVVSNNTSNNSTGVSVETTSVTAGEFTKQWKELDVIQLHGNLHQLSCTNCLTNFNWTSEYQQQLLNGSNPECSKCHEKYLQRLYLGKRITLSTIGMLRPLIVLYGENHPQAEYLAKGLNQDLRSRPDLLLIMGTSLKVDGVKKLVRSLSSSIHAKGGKIVFINKTPLSLSSWGGVIDYQILSDCDEFVKSVKREIPDLFLTQEQLDSKKLNTPAKSSKQATVMTPPTTPTKIKSSSSSLIYQIKKESEIYNRMNLSIPTPELTPASSFDESTIALRQISKNQMNKIKLEFEEDKLKQEIKQEIKQEVKQEVKKLPRVRAKRVSPTPQTENVQMKKVRA